MADVEAVLIHYAELGLKGRSRPRFEQLLRERIQAAAAPLGAGPLRWERGRTVLKLGRASPEALVARLTRLPGIAWVAPMQRLPKDMETFKEAAVAWARRHQGTFRVTVKRANRRFPVTSMEVARQVGAAIVAATGRKVDLTHPDYNYCLEIGERGAYLFAERYRGLGGLPTGSSGPVLALLSGGVDSVVAALRLMVRGAEVAGFHCAAGDPAPEVLDQAARLSGCQGSFELKTVDFRPVLEAVVREAPASLRSFLYRRAMLRLAERLAGPARALVTGDTVGQSATQTVESLRLILPVVSLPVLTPLAGERRDTVLTEARYLGEGLRGAAVDLVGHLAAPHSGRGLEPADLEAAEDFGLEPLLAEAAATARTHRFEEGRAAAEGTES